MNHKKADCPWHVLWWLMEDRYTNILKVHQDSILSDINTRELKKEESFLACELKVGETKTALKVKQKSQLVIHSSSHRGWWPERE